MPRLAALLFKELDLRDNHAPICGFYHIVDGQQGDTRCGQRFHLDPGFAYTLRRGGTVDGGGFLIQGELNRNFGEANRMTQWN